MDHKNTLNLPRTDFPMKAELVNREPERQQRWEKERLYERIQELRAGADKFVLHDGPPFANGDVHIGTASNKILKDIVVKYHRLRGKDAPYIPGWDCHGLPIEFKVSQEMRKAGDTNADPVSIRKACDAYARKFIDAQRVQFKRLGVLGDWQNPYLTLNKEYEADELRLFADILDKGFVYRGKKPVYWSIPCRTALAEAEVEYKDHLSQSIYVKFPVIGHSQTSILIWTTTPWTLPANLGVAYNSTFSYSLVRVGEESFLLSTMLLPIVAQKCGWDSYEIIRSVDAGFLSQLQYQHPFIERISMLYAGDAFVENTTGTGFVHIAPGHGLEDYGVGQANHLPTYSPVDDDGRLAYTNDMPKESQMPPELIGKSILEKHGKSDANEAVLHELRARRRLVHQENYHHSYPHCWRSKTPVIFRAMDQWFIDVDHEKFRDHALAAIDRVAWVPDWGKNRIEAAVKSRPDWCISRQRSWGVPIPAFYDAEGGAILDAEIVRRTSDLIEKHGSDVWFGMPCEELWKSVKPIHWKGPEPVSKSSDTLDVWMDSGSSSRAVLKRRSELWHQNRPGVEHWQADMYIEGSDQHRGWFQSSLLLSLAGNGAAPFKTVLTHGFMVDADREKISKSKQGQGGYEKPQNSEAYVNKYGADIVRLWVSSQDYRNDIIVSDERINKVAETYRLLRNTLRYQLSNLYDFNPRTHGLPDARLTGLDRWILWEFSKLESDVLQAYGAYEFHTVYQKVSQFAAVELSAVYHDVVKDRLYTDAPNSARRRSTQTAIYRMVTSLCKLLAPILSFTADEAWEFIPFQDENSVHLACHTETRLDLEAGEENEWQNLFAVRKAVLPELEKARNGKMIGKALEAKVHLQLPTPDLPGLLKRTDELRELLNVSQLVLTGGAPNAITITHAEGQKCERCWHWETDVGSNAAHSAMCARCVAAVESLSSAG